MNDTTLEHDVTLWMANDTPVRMFYVGRRWRITDRPTRLRESIWAVPLSQSPGLYGWRFQATDDENETFVFDVFKSESSWHVHHTYR
jgi:hypothetical protein